MVSTVANAASVDRALKEGEASTFRVTVHAADITSRGNHVSFPASVGIRTRIHVQAKELK
jgi:hypothetical protein